MSDNGFFGQYGGKYVAEILRRPLDELEAAFHDAVNDAEFCGELETLRRDFIGRPTPLLYAERTTQQTGGARIYIKMEGLAHTGAHKINNALSQALLAKKMGKTRIIAETGAGQHGLATAAACARLGLECTVYMGEVDVRRQQPNVAAMEMYGASVVPVTTGARILKDAINEAMRDWAASFETTHYLIGSALGPAPFPDMVRTFQSVIGKEVRAQTESKNISVTALVACVGGGSNAIGFFEPFIEDTRVRLIAAEAGGVGPGTGRNAVRMGGDAVKGIVQGFKSRFLLDADGQVQKTRSISAGLDYAGIGPQLADLGEKGRIEFQAVTDEKALHALQVFAKNEGVLFALESAHAGAAALRLAASLKKEDTVVVNMSGRGDKDIFITSPVFRPREWETFLEEELSRLRSGSEIHDAP
ncbi:MAG: tryptophan synthase subunit beta [Bacteroides sp.]|nr:tryptophan synthase subunit beta [Prevotella sp.]MCM1408505.1 tryptophan synthase subunit beta [Treponema brennaborense]MCM1469334.1 tryptophan synthase subunit beta [Bacteroides sp.]